MKRKTRRLLFLTRHTPRPGDDGGGLYVFDILKYLNQHGVDVRVLWVDPHGSITRRGWWIVPPEIQAGYTLRFPGDIAIGRLRLFPGIFYYPFKARFLHITKRVLLRLGLFRFLGRQKNNEASAACIDAATKTERSLPTWISLPSPEETAAARKQAQMFKPDAVMTNFCWLNPLFEQVPVKNGKRPLRLTITQDVWHIKAASMAEVLGSEDYALFDLALEKRLLMQTDVTIAITGEDAAVFREMLPGREILTVPKAHVPQTIIQRPVSGRCLFVGSGNTPNIEGLKWFFAQVWPLVLKENAGAHLDVCGNINEAFPNERQPNVRFLGRQKSLEPHYAEAEVVVCPLLRGGGMKIKLVEALAYGKSCVTTSIGLQGLSFMSDCVILADDPAGFAAGVLRLLKDGDLRNTLRKRAAASLKQHLDPKACYEPLRKLLL